MYEVDYYVFFLQLYFTFFLLADEIVHREIQAV